MKTITGKLESLHLYPGRQNFAIQLQPSGADQGFPLYLTDNDFTFSIDDVHVLQTDLSDLFEWITDNSHKNHVVNVGLMVDETRYDTVTHARFSLG